MDGTGNQINIATRGLDPHRGWEINIRPNDALTNSDMYGYPASHYNIPMEAVDRIQLRGTGSLQYGAQFGGMLNYITKRADTTKRIAFESVNSAGSFGCSAVFQKASAVLSCPGIWPSDETIYKL
jgi:Fe(3+) dicitrate transport protein